MSSAQSATGEVFVAELRQLARSGATVVHVRECCPSVWALPEVGAVASATDLPPEAVVYRMLGEVIADIRRFGDRTTADTLAAVFGLPFEANRVSLRYVDRQRLALMTWYGCGEAELPTLRSWKSWAQEVLTKQLVPYLATLLERRISEAEVPRELS